MAFLEGLAKIVCVLFLIVDLAARGQDRTYLHNMLCTFIPCALEVKSNSGFKVGPSKENCFYLFH